MQPTRALYICNFLRPFTLNAAKEMIINISDDTELDFFQMNGIKSVAFVIVRLNNFIF